MRRLAQRDQPPLIFATGQFSKQATSRFDGLILERVLMLLFLWLSFIGLSPPAFGGGGLSTQSDAGSLPKQIIYVALLLGSLGVSNVRKPRAPQIAIPISIVIMVAWCWISIFWSEAPEVAVRRVILLTLAPIVVFQIMKTLGSDQGLRSLSVIVCVIVIIDFFSALLLPGARDYSLDGFSGAGSGTWRGLHADKNTAGGIVAIQILLSLYLFCDRSTSRAMKGFAFFSMIVGALFLFNSGSKTAISLVGVAAILSYGICKLSSNRSFAAIFFIMAVVTMLSILLLYPTLPYNVLDAINEMLRDPRSFTGRSQIWSIVIKYLGDHFWLGAGYGSFWSVGLDGPMPRYASGWLLTVPHAHNGYLDIAVQTGFVGLLLAIIAAIIIPIFGVIAYKGMPFRTRWIVGAVILFVAMHDFTEVSLFDRDRPAWVLMMFILAALSAYRKTSSSGVPRVRYERFPDHPIWSLQQSQINKTSQTS